MLTVNTKLTEKDIQKERRKATNSVKKITIPADHMIIIQDDLDQEVEVQAVK